MKHMEDNIYRGNFSLKAFTHLGYCEESKRTGVLLVISGFLRQVNAICDLLGFYAE